MAVVAWTAATAPTEAATKKVCMAVLACPWVCHADSQSFKTSQSFIQLVGRSVGQSVGQSVNQSVGRPVSHSFSWLVGRSVNQALGRSDSRGHNFG